MISSIHVVRSRQASLFEDVYFCYCKTLNLFLSSIFPPETKLFFFFSLQLLPWCTSSYLWLNQLPSVHLIHHHCLLRQQSGRRHWWRKSWETSPPCMLPPSTLRWIRWLTCRLNLSPIVFFLHFLITFLFPSGFDSRHLHPDDKPADDDKETGHPCRPSPQTTIWTLLTG